MIGKLLIILCTAFWAHAGVISTDYSPATTQVIYDQPELSPIYESVNSQGQKYDTENESRQRILPNSEDFKINEFLITPSSSGSTNTQAIPQSGSSQGSGSPLGYRTSAALENPISLPSYSIGSSKIIYNSKVTPGLSAYASS